MAIHPRAGTPAQQSDLIDVPSLLRAYYTGRPDPEPAEHRVSFGTSGHRGSPLRSSFNESHLLAIAEAVARYRSKQRISGPLFLGADSHALSEPAKATVLEVLAAHGIDVFVDSADRFTPTPAVSLAILEANRGRRSGLADGIVITPSHKDSLPSSTAKMENFSEEDPQLRQRMSAAFIGSCIDGCPLSC